MRAALLLGLLVLATPLSATWFPVWSPSRVHMVVGEKTTVQVHAMWSGITDYGDGIHWGFRTDDETVALASIWVDDSRYHDVQIDAVGPGFTAIRRHSPYGYFYEFDYVRIFVTCGTEPPVRPSIPVLRTKIGEPVMVGVVSEIASRTTFHWYIGQVGDVSHPLDTSGPEITFTPKEDGTIYLWALAVTPCSTSTAQFRIEVPPARRRAVR